MKQSEYPQEQGEWTESDIVCPKCNNAYVWTAPWWDDPVEMGGACIGEYHCCGDCGYIDTF